MKSAELLLVTVALIVVGLFVHLAGRQRPFAMGGTEALSIAVEVDGKRCEPITVARIAKQLPDRRYDTWKLWRLGTLLDGGLLDGSYVELERDDGTRAGFRKPPEASGVDVVLAVDVNGKATVFLARVAEAGAISALTTARRLSPMVKSVRITTASTLAAGAGGHSGNAAAEAGRGRSVGGGGHGRSGFPSGGDERSGGALGVAATDAVMIGDAGRRAAPLLISRGNGRSATWKLEDLGRVRALKDISTERGAASAWSLRDVAATLLDNGDRISSLSNARGQTLIVSPAEWADEARLPLLRVNHRGLWKFDWVDAATRAPLAGGMRDVSGITVSP